MGTYYDCPYCGKSSKGGPDCSCTEKYSSEVARLLIGAIIMDHASIKDMFGTVEHFLIKTDTTMYYIRKIPDYVQDCFYPGRWEKINEWTLVEAPLNLSEILNEDKDIEMAPCEQFVDDTL